MTFLDFWKKNVLVPKWTKCVQIGPKMRFLSVFSSLNHQIRLILHIQAHFYCLELLLQQNWLKKFLGWKFDRLQIILMVFGYFLMFSSLEIVDFAHLSYFRLCVSIYLVFGLWKYSRPLYLAVSKLFFVSKLQFLPSICATYLVTLLSSFRTYCLSFFLSFLTIIIY